MNTVKPNMAGSGSKSNISTKGKGSKDTYPSNATDTAAPAYLCYVDDSRTSAYVIRRMLKPYGYEIDHFDSADAALDALQQKNYDLILTDLKISPKGISDDNFVNVFRSFNNEHVKQLPIIVVTGTKDTDMLANVYEYGANQILTKPVNGEELDVQIRRLVEDGADAPPMFSDAVIEQDSFPSGGKATSGATVVLFGSETKSKLEDDNIPVLSPVDEISNKKNTQDSSLPSSTGSADTNPTANVSRRVMSSGSAVGGLKNRSKPQPSTKVTPAAKVTPRGKNSKDKKPDIAAAEKAAMIAKKKLAQVKAHKAKAAKAAQEQAKKSIENKLQQAEKNNAGVADADEALSTVSPEQLQALKKLKAAASKQQAAPQKASLEAEKNETETNHDQEKHASETPELNLEPKENEGVEAFKVSEPEGDNKTVSEDISGGNAGDQKPNFTQDQDSNFGQAFTQEGQQGFAEQGQQQQQQAQPQQQAQQQQQPQQQQPQQQQPQQQQPQQQPQQQHQQQQPQQQHQQQQPQQGNGDILQDINQYPIVEANYFESYSTARTASAVRSILELWGPRRVFMVVVFAVSMYLLYGFWNSLFDDGIPVELATVEQGEIFQSINVPGRVVSKQRVDITPAIAGRLISVNVEEGDKVKKGQLLARLDDREAKSFHKRAKSGLESAQEDVVLAKRSLERLRSAFSKGAVARQLVEDAETELRSAKARENITEEEVRTAKLSLENPRLIAPFSGTVTARYVEVGQWVVPSETLFTIIDERQREIEVQVDAADSGGIAVGQTVSLSSDAFPGIEWSESVTRLAAATNNVGNSNTVSVSISLGNNAPSLRFGQQVDADIRTAWNPSAVKIPFSAILNTNGRPNVAVVDDGGRVRLMEVETGIEDFSHVEILQGVTVGQSVILANGRSFNNGDKISLIHDGS